MNPESPLKLTVLVIANTAQGPGQHETYCTCCYLLKGTVNLRASTTQCGVLHNNFNIYLCHPYTVTGILVTSNWSRYFWSWPKPICPVESCICRRVDWSVASSWLTQSIKDFTVAASLAHLTQLQSFTWKRNRQKVPQTDTIIMIIRKLSFGMKQKELHGIDMWITRLYCTVIAIDVTILHVTGLCHVKTWTSIASWDTQACLLWGLGNATEQCSEYWGQDCY